MNHYHKHQIINIILNLTIILLFSILNLYDDSVPFLFLMIFVIFLSINRIIFKRKKENENIKFSKWLLNLLSKYPLPYKIKKNE